MAALQVLQRGVGDQGAVVQLDHLQAVVGAGSAAQVSDAVVGDQLTVREALQARTHSFVLLLSCSLHAVFTLWAAELKNQTKINIFRDISIDNEADLYLVHTLVCNLAVWIL